MGRTAQPAAPPPLQTYGLPLADTPEEQNQLFCEMMAFCLKWPIEKGALPRYDHFRNICKILWPWLEWNPWMEKEIETLCNNNWVAVAGCAGSSKTTGAVIYAVVWWLCVMERSTVILTSTTGKMIRKRAWPWVQRLYSMIPGPRLGNFVDSKNVWQAKRGDDKSAIFSIAVKDGNTQKAAADIRGMHNERVLLILDEATDTPEAVMESVPNLMAGAKDFQCILLGNPHTRFDQFGIFSEPKDGWTSVDVETEEWETRPKYGTPGILIRFDAEKSPNILAGKNIYKHLPTLEKVEGARETKGADSPAYWQMFRGMWAPEGINQTVLTESLLMANDAFGKHVWRGGSEVPMCGFDPAFGGGDRPTMQFGIKGELTTGGMALQLTDRVLLKINAKDALPVHFQLSKQAREHCKQRGVLPYNFGMDASGEGGGLADILMREWSPEIRRVEFSGRPPDRAVSNENNRPAHEVYDRYVTYLWFSIREMVVSGQLKGIDASLAMELINRRWETINKKIHIEPKSSSTVSHSNSGESGKKNWGFKQFFGRSPDFGDACAVLCETAWRNGLVVKAQGKTAKRGDDWLKRAIEAHSIYEDDDNPGDNSARSLYAFDAD